jgi:FAD-dependent oxidoreductase domain-containing protein 1
MGCFAAFWLKTLEPSLRVVVAERDPTYRTASTALSAGGIRSQFSLRENIQLSLASFDFIKEGYAALAPAPQGGAGGEGAGGEASASSDAAAWRDGPARVGLREEGYLILAGTASSAQVLRDNHRLQASQGAAIALLSRDELARELPFLSSADVSLAALGRAKEGWLDPYTLLRDVRAKAAQLGVRFAHASVVALELSGGRVEAAVLESEAGGRAPVRERERVACGHLLNAAGAWSGAVARMAGVELPVEPRVRSVFAVHCAALESVLRCPLVIDPSGVYFRPDGRPGSGKFICGLSPPEEQDAPLAAHGVAEVAHALAGAADRRFFQEHIWPVLARRVPAMEELKLAGSWAGCYDFNALDFNGVVGPHSELRNLHFITGFSGHGLQMAPAAGRAAAEHILFGRFRTIDVSALGWDRVAAGRKYLERNIF